MLRLFKVGTFILCGLAVLAILLLDVITRPLNETEIPERAMVGDSGTGFVILPNGTEVSKTFVRKLFIETTSNSYFQNRRFLSLTEEGLNFLKNSRRSREELWSKEPYLSRRKRLHDRCEQKPLENIIDLTRFVFDDDLKMIMCVVPKAACTTWKSYIWYLKGRVRKQNIKKIRPSRLILSSGHMEVLSRLPKVEAMKRLMSYTSFFVARHPLERLVSAHSSKFTQRSRFNLYQRTTGKKIAFQQAEEYLKRLKYIYRKRTGVMLIKDKTFLELNLTEQEAALQYIAVMNAGNISFHQFAKHVSRHMNDSINTDIHWRPQTDLCNPCAVNYDFVVRFETLAQDSNWLLEYLQQDRPEHKKIYFDSNETALINWSKTIEAFKGLDNVTITNLKEFYAHDFRILNYISSPED